MRLHTLSKNLENWPLPALNDHNVYFGPVIKEICFPLKLGLFTVLEGSASVEFNSQKLTVDPGSFLIAEKRDVCLKPENGLVRLVVISFNHELASKIMKSLFVSNQKSEFVEYVHYMHTSITQQIKLLIDLGKSCASFHALKADMILRSLLDDLVAENHHAIQVTKKMGVAKEVTKISLYQRLSRTKAWIGEHLDKPLSLDQIADHALIHPHHFLRIFKQTYSETPHQYIRELRMQKARELLKESHYPISQICNLIGFNSITSFNNLFKKKTGDSPMLYRNKARNKNSQF